MRTPKKKKAGQSPHVPAIYFDFTNRPLDSISYNATG